MTTLRHHTIPSPLGPLMLIADGADRLCGLYLPDHRRGPATPPGRHQAGGVIDHAAAQLDAYFAGERRVFDLPLLTVGNPLQERVWARLRHVPFATTITYGQIAADLGLAPAHARAIGAANARNPLSIIVPCHRVVGVSGSLTGYAGGVIAKRYLLDHEARTSGAISPREDPARLAPASIAQTSRL